MTIDTGVVKVLVVEDECLIAMDLQLILMEAGYEVLGPAGSINAALEIIAGQQISAAIIDANLSGESSLIVASALRTLKVPYLVVTGYDLEGLPSELQMEDPIQKPYDAKLLLGRLHQIVPGVIHGASLQNALS